MDKNQLVRILFMRKFSHPLLIGILCSIHQWRNVFHIVLVNLAIIILLTLPLLFPEMLDYYMFIAGGSTSDLNAASSDTGNTSTGSRVDAAGSISIKKEKEEASKTKPSANRKKTVSVTYFYS